MVILECKTIECANWGGANMGIMRSVAVISGQLGSIASLATEITGCEILVAIQPKHSLRSDLRVSNCKKKFPGGACPQIPLAYSHLSTRNGHTSLKYLAPALNGLRSITPAELA